MIETYLGLVHLRAEEFSQVQEISEWSQSHTKNVCSTDVKGSVFEDDNN